MRAVPWLLLVAACGGSTVTPTAPKPAAPAAAPLDWTHGAVFYEIFVRSFKDSDGDGKGDLKGLIAKLDYLNDGNPATDTDLGIDAVWLMPVFVSPSYHGYDTTDYEHINPDYGSDEDFTRLCAEAHRRGIKVVVDLVLNHTSSEHPWFKESASSPTSAKRDWYVWSPTNPGWGKPWNAADPSWHEMNGQFFYGVFWRGMPDLNFRTPAVRAEAERIAALWLDRGVDGFRLDATRHLIETGPGDTGQNDTAETHEFLKEFSAFVRKTKPEAVLIGENWTETPIIARYFGQGSDELPMNFDFPLAGKIIAAARQGEAALVADKIAEIQKTYPAGVVWTPFLTNHDMQRVATNLKSDGPRLRSAAAILLTLPGAPFLYYGEEVGLENGPGNDDEFKRTPMPWDSGTGFSTGKPWFDYAPGRDKANVAAETGDPASLLSHYRRLIKARHASHALQRGTIELRSREGAILSYVVTDGDERVFVAHNLGDAAATTPAEGAAGTALFATDGVTLDGGQISLPGHGSGVFRLPASK